MKRWPRKLLRYNEIVLILLSILIVLGSFNFHSMKSQASRISTSDYGSAPSSEHVYDETDVISQWYRYLDTPGHSEAERYIASVFEEYGLNVTTQEYTAQREDGEVRAANILGYLKGKDADKCLIIGGHYDVHEYSTHGAYDNAVGAGTVIELARLFSEVENHTPTTSMIFAAWDSEEGGGAGSKYFLDNMPWQTDIIAYINLDMFSLNYPVKNNIPLSNEEYYKMNIYTSPIKDFSRYDDIEFNKSTLGNFTKFREILENITYEQYNYPPNWVPVMDDTVGASDHRFFIERGIPGVWFRGLNEKPREERDLNEIALKHTPIDRLETMEEYAGGKEELLKGIDTGLVISYSLATQILESHNVSSSQNVDETVSENFGEAGQIAIIIVTVGIIATVLCYVFIRRIRY
ncbi:MAG: M28 family peptidase [Methanomassiliicoccales archaeon]|nr:MAG: M28 family peptidase [Methanomassiliicoccales archaeon]